MLLEFYASTIADFSRPGSRNVTRSGLGKVRRRRGEFSGSRNPRTTVGPPPSLNTAAKGEDVDE
jgi:hypothetical protein